MMKEGKLNEVLKSDYFPLNIIDIKYKKNLKKYNFNILFIKHGLKYEYWKVKMNNLEDIKNDKVRLYKKYKETMDKYLDNRETKIYGDVKLKILKNYITSYDKDLENKIYNNLNISLDEAENDKYEIIHKKIYKNNFMIFKRNNYIFNLKKMIKNINIKFEEIKLENDKELIWDQLNFFINKTINLFN